VSTKTIPMIHCWYYCKSTYPHS